MGFSSEWDQRYRAGTHLSRWPWSDLVSLVMRHAPPADFPRVLELGCGAGANIPFFQGLGFRYTGVEGSPHMAESLRRSFPDLASRLISADFTRTLPPPPSDSEGLPEAWDLVVDRAALTHNSEEDIRHSLELVRKALRPGGKFIGVDWFADTHDESRRGRSGPDSRTRTGFDAGPFAQVGQVHFSDRPHLESLFSRFRLDHLELKTVRQVRPASWTQAMWNIVAVRPEDGGRH